MNCPRCGEENREGRRFCAECGARLPQTCPDCGALDEDDARFCGECGTELQPRSGATPPASARDPRSYTPRHLADKILRSKSALEGERKQVTVLFADVKGSMELAEQVGAEQWHAILDRFFAILSEGVHRFEGTVNQYTGDGIMALFGAPIAHEDHAQRACYAALHLRDELRRYANEVRVAHGLSFAVRMGINSGEVVVGKIGDDLRMDYTAQGHSVGLAARMQELAEPGIPCLTENTAERVRGYFELEDLGETPVKGSHDPVRIFALSGPGAVRTRLDISRSRGFSKFVGRANEMRTLEAALERALEGNGQVVGMVAEAGMGKSRLCFEFAERCRAREIPVRSVSGVAHGKAVPFLPMLEFYRQGFGIEPGDAPVVVRQKIAGGLVLLDEELRESVPLMLDFLCVPDPANPAPTLGPEERQRRLVALLQRITFARSERQPAILLFEDLHWFDTASEALLEALIDTLSATRTLLIANYRPEYRGSWMHRSYVQQLALQPLPEQALSELLADLLGADASLAELHTRVLERTGGNPFFIEELIRALAEQGALQGSRGDYRLASRPDEVRLPASVHDVLAARIDRLGEREKQVLQSASVIGAEFPGSLLARVVELPAAELSEALRSLVEAEFLYERALYPELEYGFKHPLTQEVACATQLRERRQRTHASVALALEAHHADALDEKAALLAHHWEQAGEPLEAARWYDRSLQWIGFNDPAQSLHHSRRVRELLATVPDSEEVLGLRLQALGEIAVQATRLGVAEGELDASVAEGRALLPRLGGRPDLEIAFRTSVGMAYILEGRIADAIAHGEETLSRGRAPGGQEFLFAGPVIMALINAEQVDRVLALIEDLSRDFETVVAHLGPMSALALGHRGSALTCAGRLGEAGAMLDRAIDDAIAQGNRVALDVAHGYYASLERHRGSPPAALAHGRQAAELAEQVASPAGLRLALYQLGHAQLAGGDLAQARSVLERALATGRGRYFAVPALSALAETLARLGEHERACGTAREAIAVAEATGQSEIPAQIALARTLRLADGLASEQPIGAALRRAEERVETFGARVYRPQICEERAELARLAGDEARRTRELRQALRLHTEIGAIGHAQRLALEVGRTGA